MGEPPDKPSRRPGAFQLPLPPPATEDKDPGDETARVRMSDYVPDTTARDLPRLPQPALDLDADESAEWDAIDDQAILTASKLFEKATRKS